MSNRVIVFIDFENFRINSDHFFRDRGLVMPDLDWNLVPQAMVDMLPGDNSLMKTYLCAPKPDEFLMQDERYAQRWAWLESLGQLKRIKLVAGKHSARPAPGRVMDINDKTSYYVVEKGSDINIGVEAVSKGYANAFDIAIIVSGDGDLAPVLDVLNAQGKVCVVAGFNGSIAKGMWSRADEQLILDVAYFNRCRRS